MYTQLTISFYKKMGNFSLSHVKLIFLYFIAFHLSFDGVFKGLHVYYGLRHYQEIVFVYLALLIDTIMSVL